MTSPCWDRLWCLHTCPSRPSHRAGLASQRSQISRAAWAPVVSVSDEGQWGFDSVWNFEFPEAEGTARVSCLSRTTIPRAQLCGERRGGGPSRSRKASKQHLASELAGINFLSRTAHQLMLQLDVLLSCKCHSAGGLFLFFLVQDYIVLGNAFDQQLLLKSASRHLSKSGAEISNPGACLP